MAKSTPKNADQLVLEALEKTLSLGKEARLITSGKKPEGAGLFSDEKGTRKAAIERCLYTEPALLNLVRTEELQVAKRKQVHRFVVITPQGLEFLCSRLSPDKLGELLVHYSAHAAADLRAQNEQFDKIVQARQRVLDNLHVLTQQFAEAEQRAQGAVHKAAELAALVQSRLDSLPLPASVLPSASPRPPLRRTATEEEARFRQRAAQQLVFAWQEAAPQGREPIERALFNLGAEQIGRPGDRIEFAGRIHECHEPVVPGDAVEIVRPGWLLRDESGGYLLGHAQVKAVKKPEE